MLDKLTISIDLSETQEADDGNTTYFGGSYSIDGQAFRAWGNDRSDSWHVEAVEKLEAIILAKWPGFGQGHDEDEVEPSPTGEFHVGSRYDLNDALNQVVTDLTFEDFTLEVNRQADGRLTLKIV